MATIPAALKSDAILQKSSAVFFISSKDEEILSFVREHIGEIRGGMAYCQLAGGDGVNVVIRLNLEADQAVGTELLLSSPLPYHNKGTDGL